MIEKIILKNTALTEVTFAENSNLSYLDISKDSQYQGDPKNNIKSLTIIGSSISDQNIITNDN
jgi:hypothetical protein